ncbi:tRNA (N6-isopentenyl adenosine(37)-C2)-methylthiotransferase MiaB [bacterium]|nr:tRNA (N6-isopentenyl adenosine(37)-C2)-methylthiotransferase MiaB [bacterium]
MKKERTNINIDSGLLQTQNSGKISQQKKASTFCSPEFGVTPIGLRVFLKTYGCQMNELDSEAMAGAMSELGYETVSSEKDADVIILNTCTVRDLAEKKALGKIGALKKLKDANKKLVIGVAGCLAQQRGEQLLRRFKHLDFTVGTREIDAIPELVAEAMAGRRQISRLCGRRKITEPAVYKRMHDVKAFVYVMRGCENFCSYCIVPYVRGHEVSRPSFEIIDEIKELSDSGYKEVCLLGQNVNSYGRGLHEKIDFTGLLEKIDKISGLERIRFMTSHPKDISDRLIRAVEALDKVCESIHFPLQSGSDKILKLMNRGYTYADYLKIVDKLRKNVKDIAVSTDIIVGFPGETEQDFRQTVKAFKEIEFNSSFIFKYSPRSGTKAAELDDDVPSKVKLERNRELLDLQDEISVRKNKKLIEKKLEVLIEGPSRKDKNISTGRTRQNVIALFEPGKHAKGDVAGFVPGSASSSVLRGKLTDK